MKQTKHYRYKLNCTSVVFNANKIYSIKQFSFYRACILNWQKQFATRLNTPSSHNSQKDGKHELTFNALKVFNV